MAISALLAASAAAASLADACRFAQDKGSNSDDEEQRVHGAGGAHWQAQVFGV